MSEMMTFTSWFINQVPTFLMSTPIMCLWGLLLVSYIIRLILDFIG